MFSSLNLLPVIVGRHERCDHAVGPSNTQHRRHERRKQNISAAVTSLIQTLGSSLPCCSCLTVEGFTAALCKYHLTGWWPSDIHVAFHITCTINICICAQRHAQSQPFTREPINKWSICSVRSSCLILFLVYCSSSPPDSCYSLRWTLKTQHLLVYNDFPCQSV